MCRMCGFPVAREYGEIMIGKNRQLYIDKAVTREF